MMDQIVGMGKMQNVETDLIFQITTLFEQKWWVELCLADVQSVVAKLESEQINWNKCCFIAKMISMAECHRINKA